MSWSSYSIGRRTLCHCECASDWDNDPISIIAHHSNVVVQHLSSHRRVSARPSTYPSQQLSTRWLRRGGHGCTVTVVNTLNTYTHAYTSPQPSTPTGSICIPCPVNGMCVCVCGGSFRSIGTRCASSCCIVVDKINGLCLARVYCIIIIRSPRNPTPMPHTHTHTSHPGYSQHLPSTILNQPSHTVIIRRSVVSLLVYISPGLHSK